MSLGERDQQVIWHPFTQTAHASLPVGITHGRGALLFDEAGNEWIDAVSSWWVNIHGHAHPYLAKRIAQQLEQLEQVIFADFTHRPAVELAERLLPKLPGEQSKVFFSDDGSTAVEVALKMAFQYWYNQGKPRTRVIALENAYHGDTFGAMSVGGKSAFNAPFERLLFEVDTVPVPVAGMEEEAISQLKALLDTGEVAAFIFEPLVQGTAGMVMYDAGPLEEMIQLCREEGVLTIADEIMTGFYRTGKMFACDHLDIAPDIFCLSKGLTGGVMAMGLTTCREEVFKAFVSEDKMKTFFHGHSYTANSIACTAAIASLDLIEREGFLDQIEGINRHHGTFCKAVTKHPVVGAVRHKGTILAIDIDTGEGVTYFSDIRDRMYAFFISEQVLLRPLGNTVYILPPYCITAAQLDKVYGTILAGLDQVQGWIKGQNHYSQTSNP